MSNDSIKIAIVGHCSPQQRSNIIALISENTHKCVIVVDVMSDADIVIREEKSLIIPIVNTNLSDAFCEPIVIDKPSARNRFQERKEQRIKSEILYRSKFKK